MLFYLDQAASMGPNSVAGINRTRGLNENLAREILELHTLGVRTGYTQDDVIRFANVLTGWTSSRPATIPSTAASSRSTGACTSPGRRRSWTRSTRIRASSRAAPCLRDLAVPSLDRDDVATKLARHFIADEPPPALVEKLARSSAIPAAT